MVQSLREFAEACGKTNRDGICDLYEDFAPAHVVLTVEQMAETTAPVDDSNYDSVAAVRDGLVKLGYMYGIKSLIEF